MNTHKRKRIHNYSFLAAFLLAVSIACIGCQKNTVNTTDGSQSASAANTDTSDENTKENDSTLRLDLGESAPLPLPDGKVISCSSSDSSIVSVSTDGTVHGLAQGKATITVNIQADDISGIRLYNVKVRKRGMVYPSFSMMKGEHLDLQFSRTDTQATWESSAPSIASVSKKGKVIAKKTGIATITGITQDNKTYICQLSIAKKIDSVIYLTFDDGPNRYSTPKVLNILKKNNIQATFFELKPAKADFDLTKRVIDEGHTLALHGYQHKYDIIYKSQKVYRNNLDQLRDLFFQKLGVWCTVSRFPGGSSNTCSNYTPGIMTALTQKLDGWGYHYFDWNVDSGDAGGAKTAKQVYQNVTSSLIKGYSNVVLMHDFYKNDKTINALNKIIQYGKKNGYTFLPITASTTEIHHQVNN